MSLFTDRPLLRWTAPLGAVALIGVVALVADHSASADPSLPPRTPAQLLVDVQQAKLAGLSGTVVQTSNLGLPDLPGIAGGGSGAGGASSSLSSMVSGTHTWRVWYAGPTRSRLALVGSLGESDVIRNGRDLWVWSSKDKSATHAVLPEHDAGAAEAPKAMELPKTPQEAAKLALAALDPTTSVTTSGASVVAGRSAYELLLRPKDRASLVAQVRISVDAKAHIPLRVQVYSTKTANPAFEVGFTKVSFATPEASQFAFNPPGGTKVTEAKLPVVNHGAGDKVRGEAAANRPTVVGKGWSTVVVATLPPAMSKDDGAQHQLEDVLARLPHASGSWGSGRLLAGTLFSAVVTDDGRVAVGAVKPGSLYAALAAK
jgi:outer membrane lipoprotein-sorting protein